MWVSFLIPVKLQLTLLINGFSLYFYRKIGVQKAIRALFRVSEKEHRLALRAVFLDTDAETQ
jgi:hypothetical protein